MLSPDYLANLPEPMVELFSQLEQDILRDIVRRIVKADFALTGTSIWQVDKLAAIAGSRDAVNRLIAASTQKSDAEIAEIIQSAEAESEEAEAEIYAAAGIERRNAPELTDILKQWIADEKRLIRNLTGTIAYRSEEVLVSALDRAYMQVVSGAFDYNTAIRQAVHDLAATGIGALETKDAFGHVKRRESLEVAVRRSVLTGVNRAAGELSLARCEEFGASLVEVSAHIGARPSHAEWQGKVYSLDGKKGKYPDFYSSTGYGTGEGLCGWNCRHSFAPYFDGAPRAFHDIDNAENTRIYEAQQEQRRHERAVRAAKKDYAAKREALDAEKSKKSPDAALLMQMEADCSKAALKLRNMRMKLKDYINSAPESYDDSTRIVVGGFGRSEASKGGWDGRKAYKKNIAILRQIRDTAAYHTIHKGAQGKHIKTHNNYIPGRSYVILTESELQELLDRTIGTGEPGLTQKGEWNHTETIYTDRIIGYNINVNDGTETPTMAAKIHYSSKGAHIVPFIKEKQ